MRLAVIAALCLSSLGGPALASDFTNQAFLEMPLKERVIWLEGAVAQASHIVQLSDAGKASCIWTWFIERPEHAHQEIEAAMRQYPAASPTGTLIGLMRRHCGKPLVR